MIVLLVVAVALGFGLSIISQSVTDIEIAGSSEESARAFNAAEAGIEDALRQVSVVVGAGQQTISVGDFDVNYEVSGDDFLVGDYSENEVATVVLGAPGDTLTIEWGESCPGAASLLITVIDSSYGITREGWNACNDLVNDFTNVLTPGADGYLRLKTLSVGANALVRIRPISNQVNIRVTGTGFLPVQAYDIDSKAQSPTLESKAIQVDRTIPATPSIFDYVLFSGTDIAK